MKLKTSLNNFKKIHRTGQHQSIFFTKKCNNYSFVENLYKFIFAQKNSFIFESVEKGVIRAGIL